MNAKRIPFISLLALLVFSGAAAAQTQSPLEQPLANFDKLIANLKANAVIGQPIQAGDTYIIPFARISFGLGGGGATMAFGGGMGGKTIPTGILIVEGEKVRAELFPQEEKKPSFLQEMLPVLLKMLPQIMGEKSPFGPKPSSSEAKTQEGPGVPLADASLDKAKKLFSEEKYADALEMIDAVLAKEPNNADYHVWKGNAMGRLAQKNPADMIKYGMGAMQEYETALRLDPESQGGHFGRGMTSLYTGNLDGAIVDFEFACKKNPYPEAYFYLGEAYKKKGLNDKAKDAYQKALKLNPKYAEAIKALGELK